jgi:15-cis-phytoene synthase
LNPDLFFALRAAPPAVQPALQALFGLDEALGRVLATGREPMVSRIRLAWWREALERLDREKAPKEPVLEAVATELIPQGISGAELSAMEEGWLAIVGDQPIKAEALDLYATRRGGLLFACAARMLGAEGGEAAAAGERWALVDLARHSTEQHDVEAALAAARERSPKRRWPRALRPLGMLAALASRDLRRGPGAWEEQGSAPRVARMMRHRLTGL